MGYFYRPLGILALNIQQDVVTSELRAGLGTLFAVLGASQITDQLSNVFRQRSERPSELGWGFSISMRNAERGLYL